MATERGAATVEFAMFAMFLVLILSGIVDLGRGIYTAIALDDAVQEGAIFAAFTDDVAGVAVTADNIKARVVASTSSPQLDFDAVTVTCGAQPRAKQDGSRVTVSVTHDVNLVTPFISNWFGGVLNLSREATAERFYADCPGGSTT